ncbi:MAG: hypothetical protein QM820_17505 [Minicystis sp.]
MSERKVARVGDPIACMTHLMTGLNDPGVIGPEPEPRKVLVQGKPAAGSGDPCLLCDGSNAVWAGAAEVFVGYSEAPLAGQLHVCRHFGGKDGVLGMEGIQRGAGTVLVGGNIVMGNVAAATRACKDLAKTRPGYDPNNPERQRANQSANNCGIESCRQIVNARRAREGKPPLTEDDMLDEALQKGFTNIEYAEQKIDKDRYKKEQALVDYVKEHPDPTSGEVDDANLFRTEYVRQHGGDLVPVRRKIKTKDELLAEVERIKKGREERRKNAFDRAPGADGLPNTDRQAYGWTTPDQRQAILEANGVGSQQDFPLIENMEDAVREGKGVMTTHVAGRLWGDSTEGNHVVLVTGMEYDENGNLVKVVYNDTMLGCHRSMDKDKFFNTLSPGVEMNVTSEPIW